MKTCRVTHLCMALVLVSGSCYAQTPDNEKTQGLLNCRYWNAISSEGLRVFFMVGFNEAYRFFVIGTETAKLFPLPNSTIGDVVKAVTKICDQPENARISIYRAIAAFRDQLDGKPASEVEAGLEAARRAAAPPQ